MLRPQIIAKLHTLICDAQFSRNVSYQVVVNPLGEQVWIGRYFEDLAEYLVVMHPKGVALEIDSRWHTLTVTPVKGD